ncbi:MAG: PPC domain-containing protein [Planctomycetaceae bacterium]
MTRIILIASVVAACEVATANVGFRQLTTIHPVAVQRGSERVVRLRSNFTLDDSYATFFDKPGITMTLAETEPIEAPRKNRASVGTPFRFHVTVPENQPTGVYELRVATPQAVSSISHLLVTDFPVVEETTDGNDSPESAQPVSLPSAVCGVCKHNEDVDYFRFTGVSGQRITAQVYAQRVSECIHIMLVKHPVYHMNPILTLLGPNGQVVSENDNFYGGDSFLHAELPEDGEYVVRIRDVRYAGSEKFSYCLEISDRPFLKAMFPLAVQQGRTINARPVGFGFDESSFVSITGTDESPGVWHPFRCQTPTGATNEAPVLTSPHHQYTVGAGSDALESATGIELPCGISGRVEKPDGAQYFAFDTIKGQHCQFEVEAHRHGLPLDSLIEIFDSDGRKLAEADDSRHSPHAGAYTAKDSLLRFRAPADGRYFLSVRDLNGGGGEHYVYYLRAELDGPDFELFGEYYYAMLAPGTRMLWFAGIKRLNGFDGSVDIEIEGLPPGVELTPASIPAGMNHCALILSTHVDAKIDASLVRVIGKATVSGAGGSPQEIVRQGMVTCELQQGGGSAQIRWPCKTQIVGITRPLDLVRVEATPTQIELKPGESSEIKLRVVRQDGNSDPVTLAMSHMYYTNSCGDQLPPGVTLSSKSRTQLKGDESEAIIVLEAAENALPVTDLPIAVMARVYVTYNISTNYASTPVLLTVSPAN